MWIQTDSFLSNTSDSWIIPVLLGSPGKWHPVLAQALACLLGSFEHLLSSLRRHGRRQTQNTNTKINTEGKMAKTRMLHHRALRRSRHVCVFEWGEKQKPCWCQRSWCTARHSAWCRFVTPSLRGPPGRYRHGGWSLKRYPGEEDKWNEKEISIAQYTIRSLVVMCIGGQWVSIPTTPPSRICPLGIWRGEMITWWIHGSKDEPLQPNCWVLEINRQSSAIQTWNVFSVLNSSTASLQGKCRGSGCC